MKGVIGFSIILADLWIGSWGLYTHGAEAYPGVPILLTMVFVGVFGFYLIQEEVL